MASSRPLSLWPREHGATAQTVLAVMAALAAGPFAPAPLFTGLAILLAFLAVEPLLVSLGARGAQAREAHGRRAATRAAILLLVTLGLAGPALWAFPLAFVPTLALSLGLGLVAWRKGLYGPLPEMGASLTLGSLALPLRLLAGSPWASALTFAGLLAGTFLLATLSVRPLLGRKPLGPRLVPPALAALATAALFLAPVPLTHRLCLIPVGAITLRLALRPPAEVRQVGWMLALGTAISAALLALG